MRSLLAAAVLLAGCSSGSNTPLAMPMPSATDADASSLDAAGAAENAAPPSEGPLFAACDSSRPCPSGWTCYAEHTAPSWGFFDGGDAFGRCTIVGNCFGAPDGSFDLCQSEDGTCTCPAMPNGQPSDCEGRSPALICVPIPKR